MRSMNLLTPSQLSQLLDIDARPVWGKQDAAVALRHQLAAPLLPDLAGLCDEQSVELNDQTFLEQLTTERPNLELLQAIKRFARQMRDEEASPLKGEAATVLYFAAIARARVCLDERISQLQDGPIRDGCIWAIQQPGAEGLQAVLQRAAQQLV